MDKKDILIYIKSEELLGVYNIFIIFIDWTKNLKHKKYMVVIKNISLINKDLQIQIVTDYGKPNLFWCVYNAREKFIRFSASNVIMQYDCNGKLRALDRNFAMIESWTIYISQAHAHS